MTYRGARNIYTLIIGERVRRIRTYNQVTATASIVLPSRHKVGGATGEHEPTVQAVQDAIHPRPKPQRGGRKCWPQIRSK